LKSSELIVFVVDDDELARNSVCALVHSIGIKSRSFASAEEFLEQYKDGSTGCLVTDLRLRGMSGVDLQEQLSQRRIYLPVIILTAYARTASTVRAIKAGVVTVLDKPYADDDLLDAIQAALAKYEAEREKHLYREEIRSRLSQLTPMEQKVLELILLGQTNKAIAQNLDVSLRTVENRRQEICLKMQVNSTAELIRLAVEAKASEL
jgi:two-component system, LuxR family, response regulator FixJ